MSTKKSILIADDEKSLAEALEIKLQHEGFMTKVAHNGEEVLELLKEQTFDLLLLDLIMPKVDGFGVLESLKRQGNTTPVIVSSNLSQPADAERALLLGARDYYIKSDTSLGEVIAHIKSVLS